MIDFSSLTRPTLLVNVAKAEANIQRMADLARRHGMLLRPHLKTTQSAMASQWYRKHGISACTVSSVAMAEYFQEAGWHDITIAFPLNPLEIPAINALAAKCRLSLILDHPELAKALSNGLLHPVSVWIEVDSGQDRSGIHWGRPAEITELARLVAHLPHLQFKGLLTHAGHTYQCRGAEQVREVHGMALARMQQLKTRLLKEGFSGVQLSYGDTPSCSTCSDWEDVDEIRPGNFVFYDLQQQQIGSCREEDIALALACPVVAVYPERSLAIIHGGAVHLSKDSVQDPALGTHHGRPALPALGGWTRALPGCHVMGLSQEHGKVHLSQEAIAHVRPGGHLLILPAHSCLTADCMGHWLGTDGIQYNMLPKAPSTASH